MLAFEKRRWNHTGSKLQAMKDEFGWSPQQYLIRLNALIDNPDALVAEPATVNRLRRLRDTRRAQRTRSVSPIN